MTESSALVNYMMNHAQRDMGIVGRGRIIIPDLIEEMGESLDPQRLMDVWREAYPDIPISQPTRNIILIDFDYSPCPEHLPPEEADEIIKQLRRR